MSRKPRILHVPTNVGNSPWILSRAQRKLGFISDVVIYKRHMFYDNADQNLELDYFSIPNEIRKYLFLKRAIEKYDIFHFNWGFSAWDYPYIGFDYLDFNRLKKAGKKIVMTYQGDDVRQKDYFQNHFGPGPYPSAEYSLKDRLMDWRKRQRIEKVNKYADHIYALNPDLLHVLPERAEFLPYVYDSVFADRKKKTENKKFRIIHAPSFRFAKGTESIIQTVKKLKKTYPIEFILVENLRQNAAQKYFENIDLAIDQLIVGWYGLFAVEMMARGFPTMAYLRQADLEKFVPFWREIPIINANKENLEGQIIRLIKNKDFRDQVSIRSKEFVQAHHDSLKIAKKVTNKYLELMSS